jgi:hypothetical protein
MKLFVVLPLLVIIVTCCSPKKEVAAQTNRSSGKPMKASALLVLDSAMGDLNMDRITDKIMIYKSPNEVSEGESKRPLEIFLGKADGTFELVERNDNVVLCYACGGVFGDPYEDVSIENGSFTVSHYGGSNWRWSRAITFSFVREFKTWLLTDDSGISYNVTQEEKTNETLIHNPEDFGMIKFKDFDNEKGM